MRVRNQQELALRPARRIGAEDSATRAVLLDVTERLMLDEGYAAVSTRRVAKQAGLTPALVHYYFPTTDDLFVALYRRAAGNTLARLGDALASDQPLRAIWTLSTDATCTALAMEFMALANHRKVIRAEIARSVEELRTIHSEALKKGAVPAGWESYDPLGAAVVMAGVSRLLVMEDALGISLGHGAATAWVENWIRRMEHQSQNKRARVAKALRTRAAG
jgi:AcrR family transcriptional regulator